MTVDASVATSAPGTAPAPPCTLVIFGASGDLTKRLLIPSLYNLVQSGLLPDDFRIVGVDHAEGSSDSWRASLAETLQSFTKDASSTFHPASIDEPTWDVIARRLTYVVGDFTSEDTYARVRDAIGDGARSAIFYFAVAARFFGAVAEMLGKAKLLEETPGLFRRIIIEKPFGSDLPTARALNAQLLAVASETQIFRIDHFLGKEAVQSIMALRFANGLYEPMWRREYVDSVQITASESLGVGHRAGFYEGTGALRDMVPNHLFQLLTMTAMEPPNSFDADDVRSEKAKLVRAVQAVRPADAVRARYTAGTVEGAAVPGYLGEDGVAADSTTETYAALKVSIENWRWSGVPFYLRTGKRLHEKQTTIAVLFKPAPYEIFRDTTVDRVRPNVMTIRVDPHANIATDFSVKIPGPAMRLQRVSTDFTYDDWFDEKPNVGYETLIYDCMIGDATLFQRADNIESGWAAVEPLLAGWAASKDQPEAYAAGSDGPAAADALLARDGRKWLPLAGGPVARRAALPH